MKPKHCVFLFHVLSILPTTANNTDPRSSQLKQFDFNFPEAETNVIKLFGIVDIAETALLTNKTIQLEIVSSEAPITFTMRQNNEVILTNQKASTIHRFYFDHFYLTYLATAGKNRGNKEEFDFIMQVNALGATSGSISFAAVETIPKIPGPNYDGDVIKVSVSNKKHETKKHHLYLEGFISKALLNNKSLIIHPQFNVNEMKITISKCDLNPEVLTLYNQTPLVMDTKLLEALERLSHIKCEEDLYHGRLDLIIDSQGQPLDGSLIFELAAHISPLSQLLFWTVLIIIAGIFMTVCVIIGGSCIVWYCRSNVRYVKKPLLLPKSLPALPRNLEEIEMMELRQRNASIEMDGARRKSSADKSSTAVFSRVPPQVKESMDGRPLPPVPIGEINLMNAFRRTVADDGWNQDDLSTTSTKHIYAEID